MQETGEAYEHKGIEEGKKSQCKGGGRYVAEEKERERGKRGKGDFQKKHNHRRITEKKEEKEKVRGMFEIIMKRMNDIRGEYKRAKSGQGEVGGED